MRTSLTPRKMLCASAAALVIALGFIATDAVARAPLHHGKDRMLRSAEHSAMRHRRYMAHREFVPVFGDARASGAAPVFGYREPAFIQMPGYIYAPGRGILDEGCNLPTSACPNTERDVQ